MAHNASPAPATLQSAPLQIEKSSAAALGEQYERLYEFRTYDASALGEEPFAVVPIGKRIESLKHLRDSYRAAPERRSGESEVRDVASLLGLISRFKSADSAVFASPDEKNPSITAIFDYHPSGPIATTAGWLRHRAVYAPELAKPWLHWMAANGKVMSQGELAAFIEEHVTDLMVPNLDDSALKTYADLVEGIWATPSDMVRLSKGLQVNVESTVKNAQTLSNGQVSIVFTETHTDGSGETLKVPTLFTICVPVFYAGQPYRIAVRLRYRVGNGKITWSFQLVRPDLVFDDAFGGIVKAIADEGQLPVYLGTPESSDDE